MLATVIWNFLCSAISFLSSFDKTELSENFLMT